MAPRGSGGLFARLGEAATLLVVAVVVCWQLSWRGFTGMANNGHWSRMIAQVGLAVRPADQGTYAARLTRTFLFRPTATDWHQYPTSAGPLVRAVVMLDRQLDARSFDLATLGRVYLAIYLIGVYGLLRASRALPAPARAVAVLAGGLLVSDYAFIAYFHSLYSEPAAILSTLFAITAGVHFATTGDRRRLAALALALGIAASAKAQYAPTAVVAALAVAVSGALAAKRDRRWCSAAAPLLAGLLVTGIAAAELALQPQRIARSNAWDVTYDQVLPFSSHPRNALSELGLSPALVIYSGQSAYASRTPLTDPVLRVRFPVYVPTTGALTAYWARHPLQSAHLLLRGGAGMSEWRPQYISNTTTSGPGGRRRLLAGAAAWSGSVRLLGDAAAPGVVALVLLTGLVAPLAEFRRSSRHGGRQSPSGTHASGRGMLTLLPVLSLAAVSQFVTVLLGDGTYELVKHLLLFDLLWGATAVGLLTWAAVRVSASCSERRRLDR